MASTRPRLPHTFLTAGDMVLDTAARVLIGPAGTSELTVGAFTLLRALMLRPSEVQTTAELIAERWGGGREPAHAESAIRAAVHRARDAVVAAGGDPDQLRSVPGVGYRIDGGRRLLCAHTPESFAALKRLVDTHHDRQLAGEIAPFLDAQPCIPPEIAGATPSEQVAA